ncbi:uncharacterized protein LOC114932523 [Nylanderia fulva]|uniref:uncharacterized protein LOC114932523 n=1 Tax=Nylanderia fulva TaxID=613905 RepID=UPI0010FAEAF1|nr:uncharacterized protein LOC114932523 [Nylanderia fulva]
MEPDQNIPKANKSCHSTHSSDLFTQIPQFSTIFRTFRHKPGNQAERNSEIPWALHYRRNARSTTEVTVVWRSEGVKNEKLGFRGQRSAWNTKNQLHENSRGISCDCNIMEK